TAVASMMVDALSVALRALSFVALFQAAGISLFLVLFGRLVVASDPTLRRAATLSALVAMGVLVAEYVLEAARMSGDFSGLMDLTLQSQVMHSSTAAALAWRLLGLVKCMTCDRSEEHTSELQSLRHLVCRL